METSFINVLGQCEQYEDASYQRKITTGKDKGKEETVKQWRLLLNIPGSKTKLTVSVDGTKAPAEGELEKWEADGMWVKAMCSDMRELTGVNGDRAWALITFVAEEVRPLNQNEKAELTKARKESKAKTAQRRAERKKDREAEKATEAKAS